MADTAFKEMVEGMRQDAYARYEAAKGILHKKIEDGDDDIDEWVKKALFPLLRKVDIINLIIPSTEFRQRKKNREKNKDRDDVHEVPSLTPEQKGAIV